MSAPLRSPRPRRSVGGPLASALCVLLTSALAAATPGPQCKSEGPCKFADTLDLLVRSGGGGLSLVANFGLLVRSGTGAGWEFVCEENFGGLITFGMQLDADGRLLVPARDGVYLSGDFCGFTQATGSVARTNVPDLAVAPGAAGTVWALTAEPRAVHLSIDGGKSFALKKQFPAEVRLFRLLIAPSEPRRLYAAGYGTKVPFVLAVSEDAGDTWRVDETGAGFTDATRTVEFAAVHPTEPGTLFVASPSRGGNDELYRSEDAGRSWQRVLSMEGNQAKAGLAFSPDGKTVYAAGREFIEASGVAPAHLYISRDGGKTFPEKIPSPETGPRYRCLHFTDGKLHACAGDQTNGDAFLLGTSTDEGKTWAPLIRLNDVTGVRACVSGVCAATAQWMCEAYGICDGAPPRRDGGVNPIRLDAAVSPDACAGASCAGGQDEGGCGCRVGGGRTFRSNVPAVLPMLMSMTVLGLALRTARRRR